MALEYYSEYSFLDLFFNCCNFCLRMVGENIYTNIGPFKKKKNTGK